MRAALSPTRLLTFVCALPLLGVGACEEAATAAEAAPQAAPDGDAGAEVAPANDAGLMRPLDAGGDTGGDVGAAEDRLDGATSEATVEAGIGTAADASATPNADAADARAADPEAGVTLDASMDDAGTVDAHAEDAATGDAESEGAADGEGGAAESEVGAPWPGTDRLPGRQLALGSGHGCSLDPAISGLLCWGDNSHGQVSVPRLVEPSFVAAGGDVTCAIDRDGVTCWGDASAGLLDVPPLAAPATQLAVGAHHACAVLENGAISCWGDASDGQLAAPVLEGVRTVGVGDRHSCALAASGVHCWGDDSLGQLDVPPLSAPTAIAVGASHACALATGEVSCWGGANETLRSEIPELSAPFAIAAGVSHTCALDESGTHCWGDPSARDLTPGELTWPVQIAVGGDGPGGFACVRHLQGVACWGDDSLGQTDYDGSPLHRLHHSESSIDAPASVVWDVLMDLESYPLWNPYTTAMQSTLQVGDPMVMTVRMNALVTLEQTENIRVVDPGHKACWGIDTDTPDLNGGERCQWLEPLSGDRTRYVTEDLIEGTLNPLVNALFDGDVATGFDNVASSLKVRAEALHGP